MLLLLTASRLLEHATPFLVRTRLSYRLLCRQVALDNSAFGDLGGITREVVRDGLKQIDAELASGVETHRFHTAMLARGGHKAAGDKVAMETALDTLIAHGVHALSNLGFRDAKPSVQAAAMSMLSALGKKSGKKGRPSIANLAKAALSATGE